MTTSFGFNAKNARSRDCSLQQNIYTIGITITQKKRKCMPSRKDPKTSTSSDDMVSGDIHSQTAQDRIIQAMFLFVPITGWTLTSLKSAVVEAGFQEGDEYRAFRGDMDQVVAYYLDYNDRKMIEKLAEIDLSSMRVKDRVATAVMVRFRQAEVHKQVAVKASEYLKHPSRVSMSAKALYNTVSQIWYACGDTSTDYNFYTKRGLLATVYTASFLFWLKDDSEDNIRTRAYLSKKLDQVMQIPRIKSVLKDGFAFMKTKFNEKN